VRANQDKLDDSWLNFDDESVEKCSYENDVKNLSGGMPDYHMAYLAFYKYEV